MKLYRHEKSGRIYAVLVDTATVEADGSGVVVYQGIDEDKVWTRPSAEFHDGRFVKLRPSDLKSGPEALLQEGELVAYVCIYTDENPYIYPKGDSTFEHIHLYQRDTIGVTAFPVYKTREAPPLGTAPAALLKRVRDFVESEVENRGAAGGEMTDYQDEASKALADLDLVIASLSGEA